MKVIIKDRKLGQENYECNVYIDGEKQDITTGRNKEINCSYFYHILFRTSRISKEFRIQERLYSIFKMLFWGAVSITGLSWCMYVYSVMRK